jgi:hypothetical protein
VATTTTEAGVAKGEAVKAAAIKETTKVKRSARRTEAGANVKANGASRRANVSTGVSTKGIRPVKVNTATTVKVGKQ